MDSFDLYDRLALWLVWLPLALIAIPILAVCMLMLSPLLLLMYLSERLSK